VLPCPSPPAAQTAHNQTGNLPDPNYNADFSLDISLRSRTALRRKQSLVENQTASLLTTWTTVRAAFQSVSPGTATGLPHRERVLIGSAHEVAEAGSSKSKAIPRCDRPSALSPLVTVSFGHRVPNRTVKADSRGESPRQVDLRSREK
jgi:hypothetical protein